MVKYGRGLNYEIAKAVRTGIINQPFNTKDIRTFTTQRNWSVTNSYLNVCLANGSSENHSPTYKKYFTSIGDGLYILRSSINK